MQRCPERFSSLVITYQHCDVPVLALSLSVHTLCFLAFIADGLHLPFNIIICHMGTSVAQPLCSGLKSFNTYLMDDMKLNICVHQFH